MIVEGQWVFGGINVDLETFRFIPKIRQTSLALPLAVFSFPPYQRHSRQFPLLTVLNLHGSIVDDPAFAVIAERCQRLVELDASSTSITNQGLSQFSLNTLEGGVR